MVFTNNDRDEVDALARRFTDEYSPLRGGRAPPVHRGPNHLCEVLAKEGFIKQIEDDIPMIDLGTGPSPHVGWSLFSHVTTNGLVMSADLHFVEWYPEWILVHHRAYQHFKKSHGKRWDVDIYHDVHERWHQADIYQKPRLLLGKKAIIHGELPLFAYGWVTPPKDCHDALGRIFDAHPHSVAIYLYQERPELGESRLSRVLPALDQLGVSYRRIDNVTSADFQPQPGGTLLLITP